MFLIPLIIVLLTGNLVINLIDKRIKTVERLSLSFGLGVGILTFLLFIFSLLGFSINYFFWLILVGILLFLNISTIKKIKYLNNLLNREKVFNGIGSIFPSLIIVLLFISVFYIFIRTRYYLINYITILPGLVIVLILVSLLGLRELKKNKEVIKKICSQLNKLNYNYYLFIFLLIIILFFVVASLIITFYWPVWVWDALTLFDSRASIFLAQQSTILYPNQYSATYLTAYPFLTSSIHYIFNYFGTKNPQPIYSLYYLSLIFTFYSCLSKNLSKLNSIFWSTLLAITPIFFNHSTFAYTNLTFVYYYSLGTIYSLQGIKSNEKSQTIIGSLLLGLATWTRPGLEVFIFANLFFYILYAIFKKKLFPFLSLLIIYLIINIPWQLYLRVYLKITPLDSYSWIDNLSKVLILNLSRIKEIFIGFWKAITNVDNYGYTIFFMLITILLNFKHILTKEKIIVYFIFQNIITWVVLGYGIGVVWKFNWDWQNIFYDSMGRMTMMFFPMFIYLIANLEISKKIFHE